MLIINPLIPFYIDERNKKIRMGNFKGTGKEIEYEDEVLLYLFKFLEQPIEKEKLIEKVNLIAKIPYNEISNAITYLMQENFIIDNNKYEELMSDNIYNRQNLFLNMVSNEYIDYSKQFKGKNILILGIGGVGANVAYALSRAGFDTFTIVDCDKVESSNLIRQYPYDENDIGSLKIDVLAQKLWNAKSISKKYIEVNSKNDIQEEIAVADLVVCTLDKPIRKIRRLINDLCIKMEKPVIFSGFSEYVALVGPFVIPKKTACLLCTEEKMNEEPLNNVQTVPSYGPLCGLIASVVANEVINYFANYNANNLFGKTLMFDMLTYQSTVIEWHRKKKCKVCDNNDSE